MTSTPVEFFFDIACPWTWITSRWVADVAPQRDLDVTWRTYSLAIRNRDKELPPEIKAKLEALYRGLRVIEAARERHGDDMAGRLYTEFGTRIHHDGDDTLDGLVAGLAAVADADLAKAADDTAWDAVLEANTARGVELVGNDVRRPDRLPARRRDHVLRPGHVARTHR